MADAVPRETWLASRDHDTYVRAIMCCQHGDPQRCSQDGWCHMDGVCFPDGQVRREREALREVVSDLAQIGRKLRRELAEVKKSRPLALVNPPCPHCGRRTHE